MGDVIFSLLFLFLCIFRRIQLKMVAVILASVLFMIVAFGLLGLRILLLKNGAFRGTCAGNSIFLKNEGVVCGVCGRQQGESCAKDQGKKVIPKTLL